jgi:hypothetical protein
MSREIGSALPQTLLARLRGADLGSRLGIAILIATPDEAGWPHPAMLSYGEVVAIDARHIRFAVSRDSRTADNLRRRGRVTFCFVEPDLVVYVKAGAAELAPIAGCARIAGFEALVQAVSCDAAREESEPGARVRDGVRFSLGREEPAVLEDWAVMVRRLREASCG